MKVLVTFDANGHFNVVLMENEEKELQVLRDLMNQVVTSRWHFNDQQKAEAYRLAHMGTIEEITDWMNDGDLRMGRSGGGKIDIIEAHDKVPSDLIADIMG